MAGRQSYEVLKALQWLAKDTMPFSPEKNRVREAARKFGVHETTLWRALGKQKLQGDTK